MNQLIEVQNKTLAAKMAIDGCGRDEALKAGALLVGGYPSLQIHDANAFKEHLIALLADYPSDLCRQAAMAIPQQERFLNIAAVKAWLEERMHERRAAYARAVERQRKAEADAAEAEHRAQVERDRLAFKAWEADHPGGTLKQYLGFEPYKPPSEVVEDDTKPCEMGPYTVGAHVRRLVGDVM